ncbi:MAG: hypothetical protein ACE5LB_12015 [Acidiferrobacterales bacterium]
MGVYYLDDRGESRLIHRYQGGEYGLEEIVEYFQLGQLKSNEGQGNAVLVLDARDVRDLKIMAAAQSFDYEEGFIEMCLEICRFTDNLPSDAWRFAANF